MIRILFKNADNNLEELIRYELIKGIDPSCVFIEDTDTGKMYDLSKLIDIYKLCVGQKRFAPITGR